jgi:pSer/pThr/pTyr-binding forkhead associated (FHA) protein
MPQIQIFLSEEAPISQDLGDEKITIGRLPDNSLQLDDGSISSHHAEIARENGQYHLHDLGSTNGTYVNDEQVTDVILKHGDEVRFGRVAAIFSAAEEVGVSQPLPESAGVGVEVAKNSTRPPAFVSSSPVPRGRKTKDTLATGLYAFAAIAIVAGLAAAYFCFSLQVPV